MSFFLQLDEAAPAGPMQNTHMNMYSGVSVRRRRRIKEVKKNKQRLCLRGGEDKNAEEDTGRGGGDAGRILNGYLIPRESDHANPSLQDTLIGKITKQQKGKRCEENKVYSCSWKNWSQLAYRLVGLSEKKSKGQPEDGGKEEKEDGRIEEMKTWKHFAGELIRKTITEHEEKIRNSKKRREERKEGRKEWRKTMRRRGDLHGDTHGRRTTHRNGEKHFYSSQHRLIHRSAVAQQTAVIGKKVGRELSSESLLQRSKLEKRRFVFSMWLLGASHKLERGGLETHWSRQTQCKHQEMQRYISSLFMGRWTHTHIHTKLVLFFISCAS